MTYADKLKNPLWQRKRLEILERDGFTCQKCTDSKTELHIHHKEYNGYIDPWEYENEKLETLCADCHCFLTTFIKNGNRYEDFIIKTVYTDTGKKVSILRIRGNLDIIIHSSGLLLSFTGQNKTEIFNFLNEKHG